MMKFFLCVAVLLCSEFSVGQFAVGPNPGCPNNAPYCRLSVPPVVNTTNQQAFSIAVLGYNNGLLYGAVVVNGPDTCPNSGHSDTNQICFYTTSTFTNESWYYRGQYSQDSTADTQNPEYPIEIFFSPTTCSSQYYKYVTTVHNRILRATTAANDWALTAVSNYLSGFPVDGATRPASFAIGVNTSGQNRIFYGNYSSHGSSHGSGDPAFSNIWYSDTCGNSWIGPDNVGGSEVHAINVDPANQSAVYATIDVETMANTSARGLWRSTFGGNTGSFVQLTRNSAFVGINFVFPSTTSNILLESDGAGGGTTGGPLAYQDRVGGDAFHIASPWPAVPPSPSPVPTPWAGSGGGIGLTSGQNIFLASSGEFLIDNTGNQQGFGPRNGLWYFAPPYNSDTTVLLEDLAPPISSVSCSDPSNGTAQVTTLYPNGIQASDAVNIRLVNNLVPGVFNTGNGFNQVITVTPPMTFTYKTDNGCASGDSGSGGYAAIDLDWTHHRTVEVTDPSSGISYVYHSNLKFPTPQFLIWNGTGELVGASAATGSPVAGFEDSSGNTYVLYGNTSGSGHMEVVSYVNGWQATDLSVANGTAGPASQIIQTSPGAFYYFDSSGKLYGIFAPASWNGNAWSGTGALPGPGAAAGSPLAGFVDSSGNTYLLYRNTSNHMEVVSYINGWQATDLSVANGSATPASQILQASPGAFYYLDSSGKLYGIFAPASWNGYSWSGTGVLPGPGAAAGSPVAGFQDSSGNTYLLYRNTSNHMEVVFYNGSWQATDLSVANGSAAPFSPIVQAAPGEFYYFDNGGKLYGIFAPASWNGNMWSGTGVLPGPGAATRSPLAGFQNSSGATYLLYTNPSNHLELVEYINGGWTAHDMSMGNGAATPVSQIIQATPGAFYYLDGNGKLNGIYAP